MMINLTRSIIGRTGARARGLATTLSSLGVRECEWYEDYRKSLYGGVTYRALLVDAAGTLLAPSQPAAQIYRDIGLKYGVSYSEDEILRRYRWAYQQPWVNSSLRFVDDGRPFWQFVVQTATGCVDPHYFEELYEYYATDRAWHLCDPDAGKVFEALKRAGLKLAVVSNFDTRLRPLLQSLKCDHWFDALAISAEVGAEKPNPTIFLKACELLGLNPEDTVHVGDDRRNDIWGARDAGCDAWLWGADVDSFKEKMSAGCPKDWCGTLAIRRLSLSSNAKTNDPVNGWGFAKML
uniref:Haloacid dehalogenase-like hydrolase domain-containing protein 3 n=1 Tax=Araucaria cunninghamii TaxID=56994 RepID=A0A0D6R403_ARACU